MDSAIAIRTSLIKDDKIVLQAGAGVVADSVPELEELEVRNKLMALMATLKELDALDHSEKLVLLKEID
jgi:anthranilate synthase component 1